CSTKKQCKRIIMVKFPVVLVFFLPNFLWTFIRGDVSCDFKQNCILPCRFQPNPELVLHWIQTPGNIQVHSFYHNQDQLGHQNKRFSGRTSLFEDQISSGNASLQLTGVEIEDEGTYKCYTSTIGGNNELFVKINVDGMKTHISTSQMFTWLAEKNISCSSEGIYPKPKLTWSTDPPASLNYNSAVQPNGQLFDITSSLTLSGSDIDLKYSCTVSTRKNTKRAILFKQSEYNCDVIMSLVSVLSLQTKENPKKMTTQNTMCP
uniref:Ig-like domain-containing protein n=1 Tax=Amphilophus citrinellus TaxID=61819 RepID=A0A3Q0RLI0_AMPCI